VIGQRVRVLLERVDAVQKRLQFSILDEEGGVAAGERPAARPKAGKTGKKKRGEKKGKSSMQQQGGKACAFPNKVKRAKKRRR
jgi:ribonuclease R